MDRFLDGFALLVGLYLWLCIACAGIDVSCGPVHLKTQKLVNFALALVALLMLRLARRPPEEPGRAGEVAPPPPSARAKLALFWLAVVTPLALVAWGRTLDGGFIREDFQRICAVRDGAPFDGSLWRDGSVFTFWSRQVSLAVDALTYPRFGLDPRPQHALDLALHLAVALATGLLALELTGRPVTARLACMLVALSPMAVEPVAWIAARDDVLAALLALVSALALARAARAGTRAWAAWYALSLAACAAALWSKESALALPAALAPLVWLARPGDGAARAAARVLPHAALFAFHVALRACTPAPHGWATTAALWDPAKALLLPLSPLGPLAFPINMWSLADLAAPARALVGAGLLAGLSLALARRAPLADRETRAFYLALLALALPVYRMIHLSATLQNNRYLYLPGVAFALLVAHLWSRNAPAVRHGRLVPAFALATAFALARMNAEPWVAAGAVATRVNAHLGVLVRPLAHERVRLDGLPDQYRGAFLFSLSDARWPLFALYGMPRADGDRLVELYHAREARPPRAPGDRELRWDPDAGLVAVPAPAAMAAIRRPPPPYRVR